MTDIQGDAFIKKDDEAEKVEISSTHQIVNSVFAVGIFGFCIS